MQKTIKVCVLSSIFSIPVFANYAALDYLNDTVKRDAIEQDNYVEKRWSDIEVSPFEDAVVGDMIILASLLKVVKVAKEVGAIVVEKVIERGVEKIQRDRKIDNDFDRKAAPRDPGGEIMHEKRKEPKVSE